MKRKGFDNPFFYAKLMPKFGIVDGGRENGSTVEG